MPVLLVESLSKDGLAAVVGFMAELHGSQAARQSPPDETNVAGAQPVGNAPMLAEFEYTWAKQTFFERCAGCHGALRKGATGPALTPDLMLPKGTAGLAAIIFNYNKVDDVC